MNYNKINLIYFSATGTTAKIVKTIAEGTAISTIEYHDITCGGMDQDITIEPDTLAIFGMPVYSGRIPQVTVESLKRISGSGTPAIIACVYGNRAYDDALVELQDIVEHNNFRVISAGAFIAQHSIFNAVAASRPDAHDLSMAKEFGQKSIELLSQHTHLDQLSRIEIAGNRPYRSIMSIPTKPTTDKRCNACGLCATQCPTQAIDHENPRHTNRTKCISCAHCIAICNRKARRFGGLLYWAAAKKFNSNYKERQMPQIRYVHTQATKL